MKKVIYESKKEVFSSWINEHVKGKKIKYVWAQICYDWDTGELLHIVFEKNSDNEEYIQWPVSIPDLPVTNIDFTSSCPTLDNGELWDYRSWHKVALNCALLNEPRKVPNSFWEWRLEVRPQGNATCDLDFLCKTKGGEYIGIEATEIYYVDKSLNSNQDVFEHFQRLLKLRRGNEHGFNLRQLKAQKKFVEMFGGRMFMLFHQILKEQRPFRLREDKCLLLEIDDSTYRRIESVVEQPNLSRQSISEDHPGYLMPEDLMDGIKRDIRFVSLNNILDRFVT